jgi:hypothetical protein
MYKTMMAVLSCCLLAILEAIVAVDFFGKSNEVADALAGNITKLAIAKSQKISEQNVSNLKHDFAMLSRYV